MKTRSNLFATMWGAKLAIAELRLVDPSTLKAIIVQTFNSRKNMEFVLSKGLALVLSFCVFFLLPLLALASNGLGEKPVVLFSLSLFFLVVTICATYVIEAFYVFKIKKIFVLEITKNYQRVHKS